MEWLVNKGRRVAKVKNEGKNNNKLSELENVKTVKVLPKRTITTNSK